MTPRSIDELAASPQLVEIMVRHAQRGQRIQSGLRALLVVFAALTIGLAPPDHYRLACWLIVAGYSLLALAAAAWMRRGGLVAVRWIWLMLLGDAAALAALTLVAGVGSAQSWTADVLVNGFFALPLLAATQLRPRVSLAVAVPTVAAYLAVSIATRSANAEPWASILLRTLVLAGLGAACVGLSRVQLSRVLTIAGLAQERAGLLADLVGIEARERAALAEHLHDGALQYLLAARQDLTDARDTADAAAFDRLDEALRTSAQLLRATVTELHPVVLAQAGLPRALRSLATGLVGSGRLAVTVDVADWPDEPTPGDALLYSAARELLNNVVKHAAASTCSLILERRDDTARLVVTDDGRGIPDGQLDRQLADGHIGLASHRARIAASSGTLTVEPGDNAGTRITVQLPFQ